MDFTKIQTKIQNLPEKKRKAILWAIVIIIGIILLFFWLRSFQARLQSLKGENILDKINFENMESISPPSLKEKNE